MDVKEHLKVWKERGEGWREGGRGGGSGIIYRAQELCECRGGRSGLPVPNSHYGFCGRKATLNSNYQNQGSGAV